ncbi:MAG: ROK family protein [Candidatus Marinimicrobia bacterium]|nr:ROK family protein [Candidatus Neomarinimicrobiota bacterium]
MEKSFIIGVDIGGTTFSATLFTHDLKIVRNSDLSHVSNFSNQPQLLDAIAKQIMDVASEKSINGVGFACPGPLDAKLGKILETPNLRLLQNCNFINEMKNRLSLPCYMDNDANLFALGEYESYSQQKDVFVGVTLGTGLGFGMVINGKLFNGAHGMAAEYGISPVEWGKWETDISINGIAKLSEKIFNERLDPKTISEMASNRNVDTQQLWNEFGEKLGLCLSHVINMVDPNAISIGGGPSNAFFHFQESMKKTIIKYAPAYIHYEINIFESTEKELSAKRGAAVITNKK